jgi:hypothetical protein
VAVIAVVIIGGMLMVPRLALAGGAYSQISVASRFCWKIPRARHFVYNCGPAAMTIVRIEGYNQNGDHVVVWDVNDHPCESDGNNKNFVRGWWWAIERGVNVTVRGTHISERTIFLKGDRPTYRYWHHIQFETVIEKSIVPGLQGVPHTIYSDWGTDKITPPPL